MLNYLTRLTIAFCLSAACFFATEDWYRRSKENRMNTSGHAPIAQLQALTNEVQRKPLTRVIWETISKDEDLYAGEAVRTSSDSEAKIIFLKSQTVIELEPDSLVVLEESEGGLALDFLKGNMFVKNAGNSGGQGAITLKSGNSEIDLRNAELSLSKSSNDQVDVQVFGGQAQVKQGDKTLTLDKANSGTLNNEGLEVTKNQIEILSPLAGDPLYIDAKRREKVVFQWAKLSENYRVFVERGTTRQNLIRNKNESSPGNLGSLQIHSKVGKYFWRLVAEPIQTGLPVLQSATVSFSILPKRPPVQLEPRNNSLITLESSNPSLRFKWANPAMLENLVVELATDPQLKNQIIRTPLNDKLGFWDFSLPQSGQYFWRLTGFMKIKGKMTPIASEVLQFEAKIGVELLPPKLRSPLDQQAIPFNQGLDKGILMTWDPVPGISQYEITIERINPGNRELASTNTNSETDMNSEVILSQEIGSSPARAKDLKPGSYRWTARSINSESKKSQPAPYQHFSITDMPTIEWAYGPKPEEYFYLTDKPSLSSQWLRNKNLKVDKWRYRLAYSEDQLQKSNWKTVDVPQIRQFVEQGGEVYVEVEALNSNNKPIARSSTKMFKLSPKPLLPGPNFAAELPDVLKANRKGDLAIKWDPVEGAQKYQLLLKNEQGKIVKKEILESTSSQFEKLRPGQYEVSLQSLDEHNRLGPVGNVRKLEVPKTSDIAAPKIKTIQVK
ncbi:MAG: FecR domain-containing protein [Bdellovibrionales bacterium]|nr:FecR domain-containing protein [Bdellovibrionales bacterium]